MVFADKVTAEGLIMDNDNKPNLSQYFANDPPSFFDELYDKSNVPGGMLSIGSDRSLLEKHQNPTNFLNDFETPIQQPGITVSDDVKDMWKPPYIEPGVPPLLTMPGVMSMNDLSDPVREAVYELLGEEEATHRKLLSPDDVTQDERGLRQLIEAGCYRSAINLTSRLLTMYGQGHGRTGQPAKHTPHSLQLWFTRFALLVKLGHFDLCQAETEAFGLLNRPDIYYEFYPEMYSGRKGSMASFSFRLLLAELPLYMGSFKLAMDRLTDLSETCLKIKIYFKNCTSVKDSENGMLFWQKRENRVLHSLINCALSMKDFSLADIIMTKILKQDQLGNDERRALYSTWGRIYLQCGDIFGAEKKFHESHKLNETQSQDQREFIDKGLVAIAQNDFQAAFMNFQKAFVLDQTNVMLYNNMGVCLLYSGKLKEAISLYETAIATIPHKALNESLLLNLSTLYELESNNFRNKKLELLRQINKYKADLNISLEICLKLQTVK